MAQHSQIIALLAGGAFGGITFWGLKRALAAPSYPVDEPDEPLPIEADDEVPPKAEEPAKVTPIVKATEPPARPVILKPDTYISPHFQYKEFFQKACPTKGLPVTPYPAAWVESRLKPLVAVLETIRESFGGRSITINSAYRSPAYNTYCTKGAATNSQHLYGRAVDIVVGGVAAHVVRDRVLALHERGLIKIGGLGRYTNFTHIDIRPGGDHLAVW